jgi:hypothetical protein
LAISRLFGSTAAAADRKERLGIKPLRKRLRHKILISLPQRLQQRFYSEKDLHLIDEQAKEAVAALLRIIAYHDRLARRAEEKDLEESWRYHETSRKDAEERLAVYEKRLAGRRLRSEIGCTGGSRRSRKLPGPGHCRSDGEREKAPVSPSEGLQPSLCRRWVPHL